MLKLHGFPVSNYANMVHLALLEKGDSLRVCAGLSGPGSGLSGQEPPRQGAVPPDTAGLPERRRA